jgi:hypothetical protein
VPGDKLDDMADPPLHPNDEKLGAFSRIVDFATANVLTRPALHVLKIALFAISPSVPPTFYDTLRAKPTQRALWWGCGLTFLLCFVAVLVWSMVDGTFSGNERGHLYFSHDLTNIINYAILCPAYVGLSAQLVVLLVLCWGHLSSPSGITPSEASPQLPRASIGLTIFIVFTIAAATTVNFMWECLNPNVYPQIGWWIRIAPDGSSRMLSPLGIYYALLNFTLLSVCLIAALAFLSLFFLCVRVGTLIKSQPLSSKLDFESLRTTLSEFTQAYIVFKLLAVTLVLNAYTWKYARMQSSFLFNAMCAALVLFGVFFISVPRYYIELEWFRFRVRRAFAIGDSYSLERDDIRPFPVRFTSWICDGIILSGFFYSWIHFPCGQL